MAGFLQFRSLLLILIIVVLGNNAGRSSLTPPTAFSVRSWPEADALFHKDPRWLGGDDAYSVDLGHRRVLWLFGDSFISSTPNHIRSQSVLINNSIAIESGYDPSAASIQFYWRTRKDVPQSFLPPLPGGWYWPGDGIKIGGKLFVFLMTVRATQKGLGFDLTGWKTAVVSNPDQPPPSWHIRFAKAPSDDLGAILSGPVIKLGGFLYAFAYIPSGAGVSLLRWPLTSVTREDLSHPDWWDQSSGWVAQADLTAPPRPLIMDGQAEFSVHFQPALHQFILLQTIGFGRADIGYRRSNALTGPWTPLCVLYRPQEMSIPDIMVYAAKSHPEQTGAALVMTYATNKMKLSEVIGASSLYFPRFLKIDMQ